MEKKSCDSLLEMIDKLEMSKREIWRVILALYSKRREMERIQEFEFEINFDWTLKQFFDDGHFDLISSEIDEKNYPSIERGIAKRKIFLVELDWKEYYGQYISELSQMGLRPATSREILALAATYPKLLKKYEIIALGDGYKYSAGHVEHVFVGQGEDGKRWANCIWYKGGTADSFRFAAVEIEEEDSPLR